MYQHEKDNKIIWRAGLCKEGCILIYYLTVRNNKVKNYQYYKKKHWLLMVWDITGLKPSGAPSIKHFL